MMALSESSVPSEGAPERDEALPRYRRLNAQTFNIEAKLKAESGDDTPLYVTTL